jgi:hypothetical protein
LSFVIDYYDQPLADKYIFVHAHDRSWHYDTDLFTAIARLRKSRYFLTNSYGGVFRNHWGIGAWGRRLHGVWARGLYAEIFGNTTMPRRPIWAHNQYPCCATFFMNSRLVKTRQKSEYILLRWRLRQWSRKWSMVKPNPAHYCGRTMEWTWHILFSNRTYIRNE